MILDFIKTETTIHKVQALSLKVLTYDLELRRTAILCKNPLGMLLRRQQIFSDVTVSLLDLFGKKPQPRTQQFESGGVINGNSSGLILDRDEVVLTGYRGRTWQK